MSINGQLSAEKPAGCATRVLTVTSGKGGVGKTNIVSNLAIALVQKGKRVMVFDADLGLANIDVILGLSCKYNLSHVFKGEKSLAEIIVEGPEGMLVLPAGSGVEELTELKDEQKATLLNHLDTFDIELDYLLIDTGAGVNTNVTYFNQSAHESIVVVTPEPTSITDAYALIKILSQQYKLRRFQIIVNQVRDAKEGMGVFRNLTVVSDRYLDVSLSYLGHLPSDREVQKAVRRQQAALLFAPRSPFALELAEIAEKLALLPEHRQQAGNPGFFWRRILGGARV